MSLIEACYNRHIRSVTFLIVLSLSGCILDGDDPELTCSCCWHMTPNAPPAVCQSCYNKEWARKEYESCQDAFKRINSGTNPDDYCCNDITTSYLSDPFKSIKGSLDVVFDQPQILIASTTLKGVINYPAKQVTEKELKTAYESSSCTQECTDKTEYCMTVNRGNHMIPNSFKKINDLLSTSDNIILKRDLMSIFGESEDPCNRSDISLKEGVIANTGRVCIFKTTVNSSLGIETIRVEIPKIIAASLRYDNAQHLLFSSSSMSPNLNFDGYLNQDYGGRITEIIANNNDFIVGTENGCVRIIH